MPDYRALEPTGDYDVDCDRDADMALEFVDHRARRAAPTLAAIVCSIVEKGDTSGLVVGFMNAICIQAGRVPVSFARRDLQESRRRMAELEAEWAAERSERAKHAAKARWAKRAA